MLRPGSGETGLGGQAATGLPEGLIVQLAGRAPTWTAPSSAAAAKAVKAEGATLKAGPGVPGVADCDTAGLSGGAGRGARSRTPSRHHAPVARITQLAVHGPETGRCGPRGT
ncbi:hypothetical protein GCM10010446_11810 [Streptomyces enissocaesilis]|uniref:Uncharacterized protein n=1 Tax=Streptomyces enissocaesilis TaxID=332589 RepID=A0ABN3WWC4_9ACTN